MKNFENEEQFNDLEKQIRNVFEEEQTAPPAFIKKALHSHLKAQKRKGIRDIISTIFHYRIPAYQMLILMLLVGLGWWILIPAKIQSRSQMLPTPQTIYVYKTDTVKMPIIQYVEKNIEKKKTNERKQLKEENEIPMITANITSNIPFPEEEMKLAEAQTGRSLHDDSTYTKLFVSVR